MAVHVRSNLADLPDIHPRLLWSEIALAAGAVLGRQQSPTMGIDCIDIPGFGSDRLELTVGTDRLPEAAVERAARTYDASRLVELAAIAVCGLALYHGGGHEIVEVAARGTGADYLVDSFRYRLEIAGRSHKRDFGAAWQRKLDRFESVGARSFLVCVLEFESLSGRLEFFE